VLLLCFFFGCASRDVRCHASPFDAWNGRYWWKPEILTHHVGEAEITQFSFCSKSCIAWILHFCYYYGHPLRLFSTLNQGVQNAALWPFIRCRCGKSVTLKSTIVSVDSLRLCYDCGIIVCTADGCSELQMLVVLVN
jgi:hypothetical protein